jgi:hypothetical protein
MAVPMRSAATSSRTVTAAEPAKHRPALTLSPAPRRRWPAVLGSFALLVVLVGMLGAAVFHTQLAERQIRIDGLERSVNDESERFDELRHRRAELRSPVRLAAAAGELGMVPGDTGIFVELDSWQVARQLAAAGVVDNQHRDLVIDTDPLEQFSDVKRVSAGQP